MNKKTGTKEWAKKNVNICNGCSHNCRYCYARQMKVRFKQTTVDAWETEVVLWDKVQQTYGKVNNNDSDVYDIMFPTTHDITPNIIEPCIAVLKNLLSVGNSVLIVSKPHIECIERLAAELEAWKKQICFRFTITAMNNDLLRYWERNAPLFEERFECLKLCFDKGFKTSISIEPALDIPTIKLLVDTLKPYVSEKIWIGIMKQVKSRVIIETEEDKKAVETILSNQKEDKIIEIYHALATYPVVCFKDSTREVIDNKTACKDSIREAMNEDANQEYLLKELLEKIEEIYSTFCSATIGDFISENEGLDEDTIDESIHNLSTYIETYKATHSKRITKTIQVRIGNLKDLLHQLEYMRDAFVEVCNMSWKIENTEYAISDVRKGE